MLLYFASRFFCLFNVFNQLLFHALTYIYFNVLSYASYYFSLSFIVRSFSLRPLYHPPPISSLPSPSLLPAPKPHFCTFYVATFLRPQPLILRVISSLSISIQSISTSFYSFLYLFSTFSSPLSPPPRIPPSFSTQPPLFRPLFGLAFPKRTTH